MVNTFYSESEFNLRVIGMIFFSPKVKCMSLQLSIIVNINYHVKEQVELKSKYGILIHLSIIIIMKICGVLLFNLIQLDSQSTFVRNITCKYLSRTYTIFILYLVSTCKNIFLICPQFVFLWNDLIHLHSTLINYI